jgi:serine/threonine protein phosphatase PrpC
MTASFKQVTVRAFGRTDKGMVRANNEDAFIIADLSTEQYGVGPTEATCAVGPRGVLLGVSDGMGGAAAGEIASALVVESVRDHLGEDCKVSEILAAIKCAVEQANKDVWEAAQESGKRGMGATLVAVLVHRALAHVASVGDSRAYIIRNGRIRQVTKDQSYVQVLVNAGLISREEAERSQYRNIILQAMGQHPEVTVGLGYLAMRRGDLFLLCSDGLSEKVTAEEMVRVVEEAPGYEVACERFIELANARGGEDNITVVIGEVRGDTLPPPDPSESVTETLRAVQEFNPQTPGGLSPSIPPETKKQE